MSYVDIAIIVLVALGALIGLWKGFFKTIISFFGWLVSFLIAFFLTKIVSEALLDVSFFKSKVLGDSGSIYSWVLSILPAEAVSGTGIWGTLLAPLLTLAQAGGADVAKSLALLLTSGIFSIIVCLALFIAIRIVMMLFTMFAKAMTANKTIGALNRLFGFLVGAVKGFATVCLIFVIMSFFIGMSFMAPVRNEIDKSVIGKPLSTKVYELTNKFIGADGNLLDKLLAIAGLGKETPPAEPTEEEKAHTAAVASLKTALHNALYQNALGSSANDEEFDNTFKPGDATYDGYVANFKTYFKGAESKADADFAAYSTADINAITALLSQDVEAKGDVYAKIDTFLTEMKLLKIELGLEIKDQATIDAIKLRADAAIAALETAINADTSKLKEWFGTAEFNPAPAPEPAPVVKNSRASYVPAFMLSRDYCVSFN